MMCNPCFIPIKLATCTSTVDEIRRILDDSISFKPRRQLYVQFSGGEPTMSPHFLEALPLRARRSSYWSVQAASNGLRFMLEPEFAQQAKEAGLAIWSICSSTRDGVFRHREFRPRHRHHYPTPRAGWAGARCRRFSPLSQQPRPAQHAAGHDHPQIPQALNRKMGATMSSSMEEDARTSCGLAGCGSRTLDLRFPPHRDVRHPLRDAGRGDSFCAYNTGVGWRKIVENMHMVAETRDGFATRAATRSMLVIAPWRSVIEEIRLPVIQPTVPPRDGPIGNGCGH